MKMLTADRLVHIHVSFLISSKSCYDLIGSLANQLHVASLGNLPARGGSPISTNRHPKVSTSAQSPDYFLAFAMVVLTLSKTWF